MVVSCRGSKDEAVFRAVRVSFDTVERPNGLDLDPEELYSGSVALEGDAREGDLAEESPRYL